MLATAAHCGSIVVMEWYCDYHPNVDVRTVRAQSGRVLGCALTSHRLPYKIIRWLFRRFPELGRSDLEPFVSSEWGKKYMSR